MMSIEYDRDWIISVVITGIAINIVSALIYHYFGVSLPKITGWVRDIYRRDKERTQNIVLALIDNEKSKSRLLNKEFRYKIHSIFYLAVGVAVFVLATNINASSPNWKSIIFSLGGVFVMTSLENWIAGSSIKNLLDGAENVEMLRDADLYSKNNSDNHDDDNPK